MVLREPRSPSAFVGAVALSKVAEDPFVVRGRGDGWIAVFSENRSVVGGGGAAAPATEDGEVASSHVVGPVEVGPRVAFHDSDGFDVVAVEKDGGNA